MTTPKVRHAKHYDRERSWYDLPDGRVFPGVTNLLGARAKPALVYWAGSSERTLVIEAAAALWDDVPTAPKMSRMAYVTTLTERLGKQRAHQKQLAKASEIGGALHKLIEWNLRKELGQEVGPEPHVKDEAAWAFMAWEKWRSSVNLKPRWVEQVVWSNTHGYAGTVDLVADCTLPKIGEVTILADWKSGKAIYGEALLQNTAYVHAMIEMGHLKPPVYGLIVRLPKVADDPEPEFLPIPWDVLGALFTEFLAIKVVWEGMERDASLMARLVAERDGTQAGSGGTIVEQGETKRALDETRVVISETTVVAGVSVGEGLTSGEISAPTPVTIVDENVAGLDAVVVAGTSGMESQGDTSSAPVPAAVSSKWFDPTSLKSSRLAKYQLGLIEFLNKARKGDLISESEDGDVFVTLPVEVLKRVGFKKATEPLPVMLSDLSMTEVAGITTAFTKAGK